MRLTDSVVLTAIILATASAFFIYSQRDTNSDLVAEEDCYVGDEAGESVFYAQEPVTSQTETIKAIYVTSWSASKKEYIDYVIDLASNTEINGVVIDIKDWSGPYSL